MQPRTPGGDPGQAYYREGDSGAPHAQTPGYDMGSRVSMGPQGLPIPRQYGYYPPPPPGYQMNSKGPYGVAGYPMVPQPPGQALPQPGSMYYKMPPPPYGMMPMYPAPYPPQGFPSGMGYPPGVKLQPPRVMGFPGPGLAGFQNEDQEDSDVEQKVLNSGLEFSNISDEEAERIIVLINLKEQTTEEDLKEVLGQFGEIEGVELLNPKKDKKVAVVRFKDTSVVSRLFASHPKFKDNPRVLRFSQEVIRGILNEQTEMVTKVLERFSKPENFAHLLNFDGNFKLYVHHLLAKKPLSFFAHSVRVREIWMGNLPQMTTETSLKQFLSSFGPVDNIDLFMKNQSFAFVRFLHADSAKKCVDSQTEIMKAFNCQVRMSYSDFLKRFNIVGDDPAVQNNDAQLTNIIFVSFNTGTILPTQETFREKFAEFGRIKNILYRPTMNDQLRPFVLIEMESKDQALKIRKYFAADDRDGRRKQRLGEKKVEVNVLLRPNVTGNLQELLASYLQLAGGDQGLPEMTLPPEDAGRMVEILSPPSDDLVWSGFLQINGKRHIGVDATGLGSREREVLHDKCYYLNLSHRLALDELQSTEPFAKCLLRASDSVHEPEFFELQQTLARDQVCGMVIGLSQSVGILVPPVPRAASLFPNLRIPKDALLLLFFSETSKIAAPNSSYLPFV